MMDIALVAELGAHRVDVGVLGGIVVIDMFVAVFLLEENTGRLQGFDPLGVCRQGAMLIGDGGAGKHGNAENDGDHAGTYRQHAEIFRGSNAKAGA